MGYREALGKACRVSDKGIGLVCAACMRPLLKCREDGVRIMLDQCPTDRHSSALGSDHWFGYLEVDGVDGLDAEFTARGAVCSALKEIHYGVREIVVTTTDGHRLVCGQPCKRN
jgi:hypothetical protein